MAGIFFGTNRDVLAEEPPAFGDTHNTGRPYHYRVGRAEVQRFGNGWREPDAAYAFQSAALFPERPASDTRGALLGSAQALEQMRKTTREDPRDVLVFLHGFANTFAMTMERAAELRDQYLSPHTDPDSGALGERALKPLVFAFSWPSDGVTAGRAETSGRGRAWAYSSDREDAETSGLAIARCAARMFEHLAALSAEERCAQRVHLVAHSMGNWALRHAVQGIVRLAERDGAPLMRLFDNVFLMAADLEDTALERDAWLAPLHRLARRIHVYHAENDSALSLSDAKPNQGARLGHHGPADMKKLPDFVSAIDCSGVSWTPADGLVRHQYYRLAPEVVQDVRQVLAGVPAAEIANRVAVGSGRYRIRLQTSMRALLDKG